jgi:glutaredoxin
MAIKLLLSKQYVVIKKTIGNGYTKKDLLAAVPGARSVPQIFLQDILVGGYDDLVKQLAK